MGLFHLTHGDASGDEGRDLEWNNLTLLLVLVKKKILEAWLQGLILFFRGFERFFRQFIDAHKADTAHRS